MRSVDFSTCALVLFLLRSRLAIFSALFDFLTMRGVPLVAFAKTHSVSDMVSPGPIRNHSRDGAGSQVVKMVERNTMLRLNIVGAGMAAWEALFKAVEEDVGAVSSVLD